MGRRRVAAALLVAVLAAGCGASHAGPPPKRALVPIGAGIDGPTGLRASVYATGLPTVAALAFDRRGRLWAAAAGLVDHRRDGVYLIATAGGRPRLMIAGLEDPLGLLWHDGRLYVASLGRVMAYSGFTGTRFARRATIIHGPVARGENNDLVLAPDGHLVMGITATCDHCRPRSRFSGSIVSFKPDGSDLRLYASRIRAPYGLAYYPGTTDLFVSMNQRDDLGTRTPGDWLAVVRAGTSWGFPACYGQGGAVCAGVPSPLAVLDKHAAAGSVVIVTGQLGPATGTAALVAQWQIAKVQRVAVRTTGSDSRGLVGPWLTGVQNPLGMVLGPDGALLVGDWGSGRIYRIARG